MGNRRTSAKTVPTVDVNESAGMPGTATVKDQLSERLARGFEILRCFENSEDGLTNLEIAQRTALPKPTVSRLAATLMRLGYLDYDDRIGTYRLGAGLLSLARPLLSQDGIRGLLRPKLTRFASETGFTVGLGRRVGLDIVYVDAFRGIAPVMLDLGIGSSVPMLQSAMGRAYLAVLSEDMRNGLAMELAGAYGKPLEQIEQSIELAVKSYETLGYCTTLGEVHPDVNAAATPVVVSDFREILLIVCGGPAYRLTPAAIREDIGPKLKDLSDAVSIPMDVD